MNAIEKVDSLYQKQQITLEEKLLTEAEIFLWQNNIFNFFENINLINSSKYTEVKNELLTIYKILKNKFEETTDFLRLNNTKNKGFLEEFLHKRKEIIERKNKSPIHSIIRKLESEKEIRNLEYEGISVWSFFAINLV